MEQAQSVSKASKTSRRLFALDAHAVFFWGGGQVVEVLPAVGGNPASLRTLIGGMVFPDGIGMAPAHDRMFWTCMGLPGKPDGYVCSASISNPESGATTIIPPTGIVNTPKQLVVDEENKKLYFADREGLRLIRCGFEGQDLEVLLQNGDWRNDKERTDCRKWCVGVALARRDKKILWTQKGASKSNTGRIFVAGIDVPANETASTRTDIKCLFDGLPEPIDLEWHEESRTLYWTDRGEIPFGNTLNKVQLDENFNVVPNGGLLKHEILARKFHEAIGLKLDVENGHIYVADLGGSIYRVNMDGSNKTIVFRDEENCVFTGIALL